MKANELRIGSIVKSLVNDEDFSIVEEIGHRASLGYYVSLNNQHSGVWLEHQERDLILGIPLTEEWLFRLGFDKFAEHTQSFGHDDIYRKGYIDIHARYNQYHFHGILINFVHELQNLYFALTKQELTMK